MVKPPPPPPRATGPWIGRRDPALRAVILAFIAAGFTTFALLYSVQPLLPVFARVFGVTPAQSSLSLSLTTLLLAPGIVAAGLLSDRIGRKPVMAVSMTASALLSLASAFAPDWTSFLAERALLGLALSGAPAVAMAYLAEEVEGDALGLAMGLYVAGTALGGMAGRLGVGLLIDWSSWRVAVGATSVLAVAAALTFWRVLPPSRGFAPRSFVWRQALRGAFADAGLPWLYAAGFLLMGGFVTIYNYVGFRLLAPPYSLSQSAVAAIFSLYLLGMAGSALVGDLAGRLGRRKVFWAPVVLMALGLGLTSLRPLAAVVAGVGLVTFGFFGAHSVASSWVGRRAAQARGLASALYLFFYYMGSSVAGVAGGVAWSRYGWPGVAAFVAALLLATLGVAARLALLKPKAEPREPAPPPVGLD